MVGSKYVDAAPLVTAERDGDVAISLREMSSEDGWSKTQPKDVRISADWRLGSSSAGAEIRTKSVGSKYADSAPLVTAERDGYVAISLREMSSEDGWSKTQPEDVRISAVWRLCSSSAEAEIRTESVGYKYVDAAPLVTAERDGGA